MLLSMTGFGSSTRKEEDFQFTVELKSINSKQFDFILKLPSDLKEKENEIRQLIMNELVRGKVECNISMENSGKALSATHFNHDLIISYYRELQSIAQELGTQEELLSVVMKMPDVMESDKLELNERMWQQLQQTVLEACRQLTVSRQQEGAVLEVDFQKRIELILAYLKEIEPFESQRIEQIKNRLGKALGEHAEIPEYDANRLEQEIIFYLEKLDFTEEKVRICKHCDYFLETMRNESQNGKKLTFITQELGREINTLGSKAANAEIQQLVVKMKDELEKIKEQLANIL
ncbi:MAG: YicC family protein [Bacteroidales bacterium]|nr:YicC family protein [Bacteroidales bacterium]